jgi:hypothetical protein
MPIRVAKRRQQKMHMIRHDHNRMNRRLSAVIIQTVPEHDIPNSFRQWIKTSQQNVTKSARSSF